MMERYMIQAFDATGELLDISDLTIQEIYDGGDNSVNIESTGEVLAIVRARRSGILHDWDGEIHKQKRIAYFKIYIDDRFTFRFAEAYITPWGLRCRVEQLDRVVHRHEAKGWISYLGKHGTIYGVHMAN
jgi:hypothetical protein